MNHLPAPTAGRRRPSLLADDGRARTGRSPWARRGEDRPLRILLLGGALPSALAARRQAPATALARTVRAITGTECAVESAGPVVLHRPSTDDRLAPHRAGTFAGAVVVLGAGDALRLTPVSEWGARLVDLLNDVQTMLPEGAPVVLVGVPDVHVPDRVRALAAPTQRHAHRLDRVARQVAAVRADVVHVPAPRLGRLTGCRASAELIEAFAVPVAAALASALRMGAGAPTPSLAPVRFDRDEVRALVEGVDAERLAALQALVERAADEFGVADAAMSLFDGERRWLLTPSGLDRVADARALTCCETVVVTGEELLVADAAHDERFTDGARLGDRRFYAGVPVHGVDGTPVGALFLLDTEPRRPVDLDRLRDVAHRAEAVVRAAARGLSAVPVG